MNEPHEPEGPAAPDNPPTASPGPRHAHASGTDLGVGTVRRLSGAVAAVAVVAVVVAGAVLGSMPAASAAGSTVNVATATGFGTILTNAQGFALYTSSMDQGGMSSCTGSCATVWPALTVPAGTTPSAGSGVTGTVAAVLQANGTYQVTYNGAPLYTFLTDPSAGQVTGNGVGGFSVVKVAAAPTPTTASPATPTTASPATPTSRPASSSTTGASPTPTAAATTPVVAPAASPASSANAAAGSSPPAPSGSTPTALAVTGPGPALMWMVIVGAALIALSLGLLVMVAGNRPRRATRHAATRAGSWLLGR